MSNLPLYEWQYARIEYREEIFIKEANKLGSRGWEMISCYKTSNFLGTVFKRPKLLDISLSLNDDKS